MTAIKPNFLFFAVRDGTILLAAALLWLGLAEGHTTHTAKVDFFGFVLGAALVLSAHLVHEWGHVLGGFASKSVMAPGKHFSSFSIFEYSSARNSVAQFLLMSFSGFALTAVVLWFCFTVLPDGYLATHIARGYAVLQVILALTLELPLVFSAILRRKIPAIENRPDFRAYIPQALRQR
ncbi:MAG: hypothetical protein HKO07_04785 [Pseudomonadales bacterium]|nr:hypothetical protein [Pseudomonadales bacterium]